MTPKQDDEDDMVNQTLDSLAHFTNLENIILPPAPAKTDFVKKDEVEKRLIAIRVSPPLAWLLYSI